MKTTAFRHKGLREQLPFQEMGRVGAESQEILEALSGYNVDIFLIPDQEFFQRLFSNAELETRILTWTDERTSRF